jgi:hypothetical protein
MRPHPNAAGQLLRRIEVFMREAEMPPSVFGRHAAKDPRLVTDLRDGRKPGIAIIRSADAFMEKWRDDYEAGRVTPLGDRRFHTGFEDTPLADRALRAARNDTAEAIRLLQVAVARLEGAMR